MKYLRLKRRRDFRRQRWQFLAVLVTIALGVMLYAASYDAFLNLESSYNNTYQRLAFADIAVTGGDSTLPATLAGIDGVTTVSERRQADIPMRTGTDTLLGRVVGMPPDRQPDVNKIDIITGTYLDPSQPNGVVVETHMATEFDIAVGDTVKVLGGAGWVDANVVGIGVSPEYIWPARSKQELFPAPGTFGVMFVSQDLLKIAPNNVAVDQTLVLYDAGVDRTTVDAAVQKAALAAGASDVATRLEQPSNAALQEDVGSFGELSIMFPVLFLLAAGMATFTLLTRLVFSQRTQIGTFLANGVSSKALTRHYRSYGVILGIAGSVIGVGVGAILGWVITGAYTDALGIPDTVRTLHPATPIVGLGFGLVAGILASVAPARAVARMSPAEAMRGDIPAGRGQRSFLERVVPPVRRLPVRWLMVIRGVGRNKRRSLSTVIGVVLALVLILTSWGMIDTVQVLLDRQFNDVAIEDVTVVFQDPVTADVVSQVASRSGVAVAEPVVTLSVSAAGAGGTYATELRGYEPNSQVHGFLTDSGLLPPSGILAGSALVDQIGARVGDVVTLTFPQLSTSINTTIAGFVTEPVGTVLYMDVNTLRASLAAASPSVPASALTPPSITSVAAVFDAGADRASIIAGLKTDPSVAVVVDNQAFYDLVAGFMGFFYMFVGVMLAFGAAMAFSLIFNTISVNVAERSGEYASMRANGLSLHRIGALIVGENLFLTILGIIPGLVVGYFFAYAYMGSFSSDLFSFNLEMRGSTLVLSALAMVAVAALSLVPGIRSVRNLDVAAVVRERSL